jgi:hypothetical protein
MSSFPPLTIYKPIEIPKVNNTNINPLPTALAVEDIAHMVYQVVSASLASRL